ncbi:hypothetical protein ACEWY4_013854 [Coilia grayii]|uniref:Proline-rich transmembrane protein 3/4 domain-containing protein n=1 Tax=Coilia grayii TaxID=363190 RepID=A0ABD1JXN2_9TELE
MVLLWFNWKLKMQWNIYRILPLAITLFWLHQAAGSPIMSSTKPSISEPQTSLLLEANFNGLDYNDRPPTSSSSSSVTFQWAEHMINNYISQTLEDSFMSFTQIMESSGDGSGFQEEHNELKPEKAPSVSLMDENMILQELEERGGWEDAWYKSARSSPLQQIQLMDADRSPEITDMPQESNVVTSTQSTPISTSTFSLVKSVNTGMPIITETTDISPRGATQHLTTIQMILDLENPNGKGSDHRMKANLAQRKDTSGMQDYSGDAAPDGATVPGDEASNAQVTPTDSRIAIKAYLHHQQTSTMDVVTKTTQSNQPGQDVTNPTEIVPEVPSETPFSNDELKQSPPAGGLIGPGSCLLGSGLCAGPSELNGTTLKWEDLSRTLAFAWELHVFGCATLFLVLVVGSLWGITGATGLLRPYSVTLPMANTLLLLAGVLRCAHFLIDPYGTRHIVPRPTLSALYNLPLPLLLWAQAVLATVVLRGQRLKLLPRALQSPRVTGGLVALHCSLLFMADMLSQAVSPALPLMLQTFSVCWGLPLCLGLLFQTLNPSQLVRTPVPLWLAAKHVEDRTRQVFALCTVLGALSYTLQIHGVLWLYGLLGDWKHFSWGWWVAQFSARLLELTWSYSLLLLSSWVFWRPRGCNRREGRPGATPIRRLESCWDGMLDNLPKGPWREPDRHWAGLIPNNWAAHQRTRPDISSSMIRNYEVATTSQSLRDSHSGSISSINSIMCDSRATPPWLHGHNWSERDCILSLIEFDLCPPSPISLSTHSIDNALLHDDLGVGSLFTLQPPSWTQGLEPYCAQAGSATVPTTPTHIAYRWALDAGSSPVQPHCFGGSSHHSGPMGSDAQHSQAVGLDAQHSQPMGLNADQSQPMVSVAQSPLSIKDLKLHLEEPDPEVVPGIRGVAITEDDWGSVGSTDDITDL